MHCTQAIMGWALFAWRGEDHPWIIVHGTFLLPDGWRHSNKFKFWWKASLCLCEGGAEGGRRWGAEEEGPEGGGPEEGGVEGGGPEEGGVEIGRASRGRSRGEGVGHVKSKFELITKAIILLCFLLRQAFICHFHGHTCSESPVKRSAYCWAPWVVKLAAPPNLLVLWRYSLLS